MNFNLNRAAWACVVFGKLALSKRHVANRKYREKPANSAIRAASTMVPAALHTGIEARNEKRFVCHLRFGFPPSCCR